MFDFLNILIVSVALGADAFSVALGIGGGKAFRGQSFRLGFHFGLFQFLMPLIGFWVGRNLEGVIGRWNEWIAFAILLGIGLHMILDAMGNEEQEQNDGIDRSRGWYLVSLSLATSMDALAVGVALGMADVEPWWPSLLIGVVAGIMALIGLHLGRKLRRLFGQIIEILGGSILIFIAAKMFLL
ncbi:manganese efflux pump [bacterium]|nr:manganese efflux pump [bacterium]